MQRSESRRKAELSTFSDEGIEGQLEKILLSFRQKIHGILGSVIADSNGLTVASDVKGGVSSSVLSAMSTLIAQSGARVFENIQMHGPTFIIMDGDQANVAVVQFAEGDVSRYGTYQIHSLRGPPTVAAAIRRELDAEPVRYLVSDALKDFEAGSVATPPSGGGDIAESRGMEECFERVLKS